MQPDLPTSSVSRPGMSTGERAAALLLGDLRQAWPVLLLRAVLAVARGLVAFPQASASSVPNGEVRPCYWPGCCRWSPGC